MRTPSQPETPDTSSSANRRHLDSVPEIPATPPVAPISPSASPPGSSFVTLLPAQTGSSRSLPAEANSDDSPTIITSSKSPSPPELAALDGRRLGHFELMETVGSGGMAAVLKARDLELGRIVALKILPPHMAQDTENVTRFKQEGRAAARLDHENVARAFYCGEDQGLHFIAFEYIEGENLRTLIDRRGTISPADCVRYMLQVSAGLAHAAARGVVHRDIKPSNLIITPDGRVKIVDMGLARHTGSQSVNGGVTQSGTTLGTFDYISPEQALDPRRVDVRSDIYSLGCAFYHALTGRPPVPEGTAAKKLFAHQHEPVVDPREYNPSIPNALAAILARMMAKDVNRRYQTPAELTADLLALARMMDLPSETLPVDVNVGSHARVMALTAEPPQLPLGLAVAIAGVAVVLAVAVGVSRPDHQATTVSWGELPSPSPTLPALPASAPPMTPVPPMPPTGTDPRTPGERLAEQLQSGQDTLEVALTAGAVYDLTRIATGIRVQARTLRLTGDPAQPAVIRLAAVPLDPGESGAVRPQTLTIAETATVEISGVRFVLADGPPVYDRPEAPVGLTVAGCQMVSFRSCRFETAADLEAVAVTGLAVVSHRMATSPTECNLTSCYFAVRQTVGAQLVGSVRASVTESAFAPHQSAFALRALAGDPANALPGDLSLRHCTFLLDQKGVVAEAADQARWQVSAGYCLFATPAPPDSGTAMAMMMMDPAPRPAVLKVKRDDVATPDARFSGLTEERNVYFGVDPFATNRRSYTLAEYRDTGWGDDPAGVELRQAPWAVPDPGAGLTGDTPWNALRLKIVSEVRVRGEVIVGARFLPSPNDKFYHPWPPPSFDPPPPANARVKVWWPDQPADAETSTGNTFTRLEEAIRALNADDELLVRGNGPVLVPPVLIDKKITIKAFPGTQPILVPATTRQRSLFRVIAGELLLDGLEFRLPRLDADADPVSSSVVALVSGRKLTLQHCIITCDARSMDEFSAVSVTPFDDSELTNGAGVQIELDRCLIRGRGCGVWVKAARRFDLTINDSAIVTTGPLLTIDPAIRESSANAVSLVRLSRVTAVLEEALLDFRVRADDEIMPRKWVPVKVDANECLFAQIVGTTSVPLVLVSGTGKPKEPSRYLTWQSTRPNWYPNRADAVFLRLTPMDTQEMPNLLPATDWFTLTHEDAAKSLGKVTFVKPPTRDRLGEVLASDLEVLAVDIPETEVGAAGAEVAGLPQPAPVRPTPSP
ncbi:MAG: serine/threonine protein kinase [Bacteroidales bacterium]|nr:serine/threonine protein kinase [Bacteroidales bacterium]